MLNREDILAQTDLKTEIVNIKEWGGDVLVSEMSGTVRDAWEQTLGEKDGAGKIVSPRAKLVVFTVVDEQGNRLFKDNDIDAIGKLSASSLEQICITAMKLNGIGDDEIEEAKKN